MQLRSDVYRESDRILVEIEVPGIRADSLELKVGRDRLLVRVHPRKPTQGRIFHRRERGVGPSLRELPLPAPVAVDRVRAHLEDGLLRIVLPLEAKAELAPPEKDPAEEEETEAWPRPFEVSAA